MKKAQKFAQNNATEWKARGFKTSNAPTINNSEFSEMPEAGNSSSERFQNTFGSPSRPRHAGAKPFSKFGKPKTPTDHEETSSPDDIDPTTQPQMKKKKVKDSEKSGEKSQDKSPKKTGVDRPSKKKKKTPEGEEATPSEGHNVGEVVTSKNQKRKKQKFQGYTLFIGNLSYDTTVEDIQNHFAKCGTIKNVRLPLEKVTNQPRGFGYIEVEEHVTYEVICLQTLP